ncbi:glycerophosphodiester phosphodiesterase [Mucilaginibacter agri]|uniref:Glycerophosphodiester phosphodiesterase n=1 Tax=Mucilaginibacter agri TaxID=2695265 RepID=A0A965ZJY1_9SPHI|nr:glycerophosphodiester phosphodiesterase family protein [Mucilaginibacter agri]NCD71016.1 glycerophosphodiester phosphodiesterase [Mucilaginibacter agri]
MKKLILLITGVSLSLSLFAQNEVGSYKPNPVPHSKHRFIVVAHRGDHTLYPENTIEAYEQAIMAGADYIEIDLRTTKDGKLVSLHDASVNRMTNGKGSIKTLTLTEVSQLEIKYKDSVCHIPTFENILNLSRNRINLYIDFKDAAPGIVYQILKQHQMDKQVLIYINSADQFVKWRKVAPKIPLMVSMPDSVKSITEMQQFIERYHPDILDGDYSQYSNEMVAWLKAHNIPAWPDAQSPTEGPAVWQKAAVLGLLGLQTDNPETLIKYLKENGLR